MNLFNSIADSGPHLFHSLLLLAMVYSMASNNNCLLTDRHKSIISCPGCYVTALSLQCYLIMSLQSYLVMKRLCDLQLNTHACGVAGQSRM